MIIIGYKGVCMRKISPYTILEIVYMIAMFIYFRNGTRIRGICSEKSFKLSVKRINGS